jgi:hypothetical protein
MASWTARPSETMARAALPAWKCLVCRGFPSAFVDSVFLVGSAVRANVVESLRIGTGDRADDEDRGYCQHVGNLVPFETRMVTTAAVGDGNLRRMCDCPHWSTDRPALPRASLRPEALDQATADVDRSVVRVAPVGVPMPVVDDWSRFLQLEVGEGLRTGPATRWPADRGALGGVGRGRCVGARS